MIEVLGVITAVSIWLSIVIAVAFIFRRNL
jgi:hypothetical protein